MATNVLIKKAGAESEYDDFKISEIQKCMDDPIYFMRTYVKIQHPTKGAVLFDLYPFQENLVRQLVDPNQKYTISMQSRQSGKSSVACAFLVWWTNFKDDQTVLVLSRGMKHAVELMDRCRFAWEELPHWLKAGCKEYNKSTISFDNGSKIISSPVTLSSGRGYSISLLYWDECAFTNPSCSTGLWNSLFPTLSTGGRAIITSTPNGDSDLFATLWRGAICGTNDFKAFFANWDEVPGRDEKWKQTMIGAIGPLAFLQECCCQFVSSDALLFSSLKMQTFKTSEPIREQGMFRFWKEPDPTKAFIVGCDVASGTGSDFSTITVLEFPSLFQVAEFRNNTISLPQLYGRYKWIINYLSTPLQRHGRAPECFHSWENNGLGHALIALYQNDENPPMGELISTDNKQLGCNTNGKTKIAACLQFKSLVEKAKNPLQVNSDLLLAEMKNYVQSGGSYAAKPGATDDLISSVLICLQIIKKMATFDELAHKLTYQYDEVNRGLDNDGNFVEEDLDSDQPFGIF